MNNGARTSLYATNVLLQKRCSRLLLLKSTTAIEASFIAYDLHDI